MTHLPAFSFSLDPDATNWASRLGSYWRLISQRITRDRTSKKNGPFRLRWVANRARIEGSKRTTSPTGRVRVAEYLQQPRGWCQAESSSAPANNTSCLGPSPLCACWAPENSICKICYSLKKRKVRQNSATCPYRAANRKTKSLAKRIILENSPILLCKFAMAQHADRIKLRAMQPVCCANLCKLFGCYFAFVFKLLQLFNRITTLFRGKIESFRATRLRR